MVLPYVWLYYDVVLYLFPVLFCVVTYLGLVYFIQGYVLKLITLQKVYGSFKGFTIVFSLSVHYYFKSF